jgi:AcrR family transcriptional regulator
MDTADTNILDAVIDVVHRYGIKRTTMDDLSRHAGVSRQTLYDRFGGKDAVMAAAITLIGQRLSASLTDAFAEHVTLDAQLESYFDIAVWPIFDVLQSMPDAADLERGLGPLSSRASDDGSRLKQKVLEEMFNAHLRSGPHSPAALSVYFEQSCARAKMSGLSRAELTEFLAVLKASTLALVASY